MKSMIFLKGLGVTIVHMYEQWEYLIVIKPIRRE